MKYTRSHIHDVEDYKKQFSASHKSKKNITHLEYRLLLANENPNNKKVFSKYRGEKLGIKNLKP